ncbi:unnamed protein product, partial [Brenthis ino]
MFGFSELEDICEDLELVKLCDEIEAKQKPHLVDPSYDDELYKFLLWLKKNSQRSSSLSSYEIQTGSGGLRKRSAEDGDKSMK